MMIENPITFDCSQSRLKIRVMESPLMVNTLNAMGGAATPMSYSELYTELEQAVLEEEAVALQDYEIQLTEEVGQAAIAELQAKGMKINEADVAAFRERMAPVYTDFTAKHGSDLLQQVQQTK